MYHNYLNSLASAANVVAVSVNYRLHPEYPLPAAYDDWWAAVKWVASVNSHVYGNGSEDWLNLLADFHRVFSAGDSAGANIAYQMGLRVGSEGLVGEKGGLRDGGWYYGEILRKSGWSGVVEVVEAKGEEHVFHLFKPSSENAVAKEKKIAYFLN
nr:probable carboxylesterase 12 [Malus domestica]